MIVHNLNSMTSKPVEDMEYSIHPPSPFIQTSWQKLLPTWDVPVSSLLILLQRSPIALRWHTPEASLVKARLRTKAIRLMMPLVYTLRRHHYPSEMFDPKTGSPYCSDAQDSAQEEFDPESSVPESSDQESYDLEDSAQGCIPLNDVAVIQAILGYTTKQHGQCRCIVHPIWGDRVYPSILMSASSPMTVKPIAEQYLHVPMLYQH